MERLFLLLSLSSIGEFDSQALLGLWWALSHFLWTDAVAVCSHKYIYASSGYTIPQK